MLVITFDVKKSANLRLFYRFPNENQIKVFQDVTHKITPRDFVPSYVHCLYHTVRTFLTGVSQSHQHLNLIHRANYLIRKVINSSFFHLDVDAQTNVFLPPLDRDQCVYKCLDGDSTI